MFAEDVPSRQSSSFCPVMGRAPEREGERETDRQRARLRERERERERAELGTMSTGRPETQQGCKGGDEMKN